MAFIFLNDWKKIKTNISLEIVNEIQISVSTNKILLEDGHAYSFATLLVVYGCFYTTKAELSIYNANLMANKT